MRQASAELDVPPSWPIKSEASVEIGSINDTSALRDHGRPRDRLLGRPRGASPVTTPRETPAAEVFHTPPRCPAPMPMHQISMIGLADILAAAKRIIGNLTEVSNKHSSECCQPGREGSEISGQRPFKRRLAAKRWLYLGLVCTTTAAGIVRLWPILRVDGVTFLESCLLAVFTVLFAWIASSFWLACFGVYARWRGAPLDGLQRPAPRTAESTFDRPRTALLMPVYNEDAERVFAGLMAICESLRADGSLNEFDVYVLSDSTDLVALRAEAHHLARLKAAMAGSLHIYYRHRTNNKGRKSGNIADFCENWGSLYDYMVVLDADSLMTGETLRELVQLMDANPNTGLIQVPPIIVGRESLFARIQQFASSVYGPVYAAGLAYLQGGDGNYWGHNAIIRVKPFTDHCGLPTLPGKAPLGGEIMSHDFVEAAFLRRAGWDVWLVPGLGGSYEETPTTTIDHLTRERRWCQGNLQHSKLILMQGLKMPSRLHLGIGIMSYLSSPLWLLFLILLAAEARTLSQIPPVSYVGPYPILSWSISHVEAFVLLISAMIVFLFGPKFLAFLLLARDETQMDKHGGPLKSSMSIILESVFSMLFAPVAMLTHSWFVLTILSGRTTGWSGQQRTDHILPLAAIARAFAAHSIIGVSFGIAAYLLIPSSVWWLSPILAGLVLAMPLAYLTSGPKAGRWARERGLFLISCETVGVKIVDRMAALLTGDVALRAVEGAEDHSERVSFSSESIRRMQQHAQACRRGRSQTPYAGTIGQAEEPA